MLKFDFELTVPVAGPFTKMEISRFSKCHIQVVLEGESQYHVLDC